MVTPVVPVAPSLFTVRHVGRLVEARISGDPTLEDVGQYRADSHACVRECLVHVRRPAVICTDIRATGLLRPEVSQALMSLLRTESKNIERSALLGHEGGLFAHHLSRLLQEDAVDDRRRVFTEADPLYAWLDGVLADDEKARLREFVLEGAKAPAIPSSRPPPPRPSMDRARLPKPSGTKT